MQTCWGTVGSLVFLLFSLMVENKTVKSDNMFDHPQYSIPWDWHLDWSLPLTSISYQIKISFCMVSLAERQSQLEDLSNSFFFYYCVFMCLCVCMCVLTDVYAHMCMDVEDRSWCQMPWLITVCVCKICVYTYIWVWAHTWHQRTTSDVGPHLPSCLKQGLSLPLHMLG